MGQRLLTEGRRVTSTSFMHTFIEEFGEGNDKVEMMKKLKMLRRQVKTEIFDELVLKINLVHKKADETYKCSGFDRGKRLLSKK